MDLGKGMIRNEGYHAEDMVIEEITERESIDTSEKRSMMVPERDARNELCQSLVSGGKQGEKKNGGGACELKWYY